MAKPAYATGNARSEPRCADQMLRIAQGLAPLMKRDYTVLEVAERYAVHFDTVYKGVRRGDPMYPLAVRSGPGSRSALKFSRSAIQTCDQARIDFYRTTPSGTVLFCGAFAVVPPRRSARIVISETQTARAKVSRAAKIAT